MPIVGMRNSRVICAASSRGTASSTTANAPAASTTCASLINCTAASAVLPCTRYPPRAFTDCDVKPTCPITAFPALHLRALGSRFLHETHSIVQRPTQVGVITAVRHVRHKKRAARSAAHSARMVQHLVNRDRQRTVMPQHDHAKGIADKNQVHAGLIEQARGRVVIRRQASDFLEVGMGACSLGLALQEVGHGYFSVPGIGDNAHGGLRCRSLKSRYSPVPHLCTG